MATLSRSDAEQLLRLVAEAESSGADQLFTPELLVEVGRLIEADWVWYAEVDHVRHRQLFAVCRLGDDEDAEEDDSDLYELVRDEHPVCTRLYSGKHRALKLSDFVSLRELRRSRIYDLWFSRIGVERMLAVAIPSAMWHRKHLVFERGTGRDFTERDRGVLNHLLPHLAPLWHAARVRRVLRASLAELAGAEEHGARGVVLLGTAAEIEFASPPAQRLLRDFFPPAAPGRLPSDLAEWLETGLEATFIRRDDERRLVVRRAGDSLLLEERVDEVALTAREREVLSWVARGKTNSEIAQMLWLAPSTVRKHLENVYAKLGVSTRTAAVARFFGLNEAS